MKFWVYFVLFIFTLTAACENRQPANTQLANTNTNVNSNTSAPASPLPSPSPAENRNAANAAQITLPILDALFTEENFAGELKNKLGLPDDQIEKLRMVSRQATAELDETEEGSTAAEQKRAEEQIRNIIGADKTAELARFIAARWEGENNNNATAAAGGSQPNAVPTDTRVVVNAPAYRMDVFKDGQLVKSYKIGIGYPEFPLPTGMRRADTIIFNPTWTPPDEPWVKGKLKPGEKVEAGSKLNPLGPIKIPIGLPSLIHGGKQPARLGNFASHGCVGLTNQQVQDFAVLLAQTSGTQLTPADVKNYEKQKTETKNVKLAAAMPVELRYETIVVENGKLKIYRDVYERGTNTETNLRRVLETHGVTFDSLSEQERTKILEALKQMARDPQGNPVTAPSPTPDQKNSSGKETKSVKGAKEMTIELAALAGKGYPAPKDAVAVNATAKK